MITIKNGIIYRDGKQIGTATQDLRFGYHPAIHVVVGEEGWFEIDTPYDEICKYIRDFT